MRRTNLTALGSGTLSSTAYGYDTASRLATVNDGHSNTATYSYLANSPLVGQIVFATNGATRMTTTKQYDYLNRLTQISSLPSGNGLLAMAYSYNYNAANQRTQNTFSDGSHWVYQYDALGQVTSGKRYWSDGTAVAGEQFGYAFDTIGNRMQTQTGGDTNGLNLRVANYQVNNLNQILQRDVPGTNDIVGAARVGTNVTVNGVAVVDRKAEFFHSTVGTNNAAAAAWLPVTVTGAATSTSGSLYVAQEPEQFAYDADGNLTNDGRWAYTWDGENRLIGMTNNTGVGPLYGLSFVYDSQGRRIQKIVTTNGVTFTTNNFLYDGWNLIAVLSQISNLQSTFVWGTDLSGSPQGAGGVGGLLAIGYHGASATTNAFVAYDANGNVSALVNAGDGTILANYEYGPFGEPIRLTGPLAKANPFRFSTKYQDDETDLLYYGYRYYKASTGTWLSRDPLAELAFQRATVNAFNSQTYTQKIIRDCNSNLYRFVHNDPLDQYDRLGLASVWWNGSTKTCPNGSTVSFAQVGWGGYSIWGLNSPFVDNGTRPWGIFAGSGCLEYPFGHPYTGSFDDSPSWDVGPVQFVTCQLCVQSCCINFRGTKSGTTRRVAGHIVIQVGPCKKWKAGDSGDLSTFPDASPQDVNTFTSTIAAQYPGWQSKCYSCSY